eukprot:TRINITY_DN11317_c0_g1_i1.p1 TRINITY_DN11317_c0_g1~~TRINITY_DN11317_c0_g1_i1.p1  ORF type:complete len:426 (-),score=91.02 TRINITY_DN11317_c0_g1_i1:194-1318(-)
MTGPASPPVAGGQASQALGNTGGPGIGLGGPGLGGPGLGGPGLGGPGLGGPGLGGPSLGGPGLGGPGLGGPGLGGPGLGGPGLGGPGLGGPGLSGLGSDAGGTGGGIQLPTMNLFGGGGGGGGGGGAWNTPSTIQQLQATAVQNPKLDSLCPGKNRRSTDIGAECWAAVWANGGCNAENVPKYEDWHRAQTLEVLVADVVQWANLPDDRHKQGCYGSAGPPVNEPAPPQPAGARGLGGAGGLGGGLGALGGGVGGGRGGMGGLGGGVGGSPQLGQQQQQQQMPPEVVQKIEASLQSPELPNLCPGKTRQSTNVGEECWKKIWGHVGCRETSAPPYEQWHQTQSLEVLVADAAQWASLPSEKHREACYGSSSAEL